MGWNVGDMDKWWRKILLMLPSFLFFSFLFYHLGVFECISQTFKTGVFKSKFKGSLYQVPHGVVKDSTGEAELLMTRFIHSLNWSYVAMCYCFLHSSIFFFLFAHLLVHLIYPLLHRVYPLLLGAFYCIFYLPSIIKILLSDSNFISWNVSSRIKKKKKEEEKYC